MKQIKLKDSIKIINSCDMCPMCHYYYIDGKDFDTLICGLVNKSIFIDEKQKGLKIYDFCPLEDYKEK